MSGVIRSAAEANPPDPELLEGQDGETRALLRIGFAIRALPLAEALRVARIAKNALAVVNHEVKQKLIDGHMEQVPKGPLKITRETVKRVWAEAGGRRIEFVNTDDRWFAILYE